MSTRRTFLHGGLLLAAHILLGGPVRAQPAAGALRMAVHPYAGALSLVNTYKPLQRHLEAALQRPVEFYTAASFEAYVASLMAGEYDIAITPPHFGVLAMEKGYAPLAHFKRELEPVLAVRAESNIRAIADLRSKRVAMADKSAFIRIIIVRWLSDNGLVSGRDYEIVERPTHAASSSAVVVGEADAALTTTTAVAQMAADVQKQLFLLTPGLRFPHLFTLAHERLGDEGIRKVRAALASFTPSQADGREFFAKSGFIGYEDLTDDELRRIRPYAEAYRRMAAGN